MVSLEQGPSPLVADAFFSVILSVLTAVAVLRGKGVAGVVYPDRK